MQTPFLISVIVTLLILTTLGVANAQTVQELIAPRPDAETYFSRHCVYENLRNFRKAGQDIDKYIEPYNAIEKLAAEHKPKQVISDAVVTLSNEYSEEFANKGQEGIFEDQVYGPGPLTKVSNEIEAKLRSKWKINPNTKDVVLVCFTLEADGKVSDIHDHYGNGDEYNKADLARAKALIATINHPSPFDYPVPMQLRVDDEFKTFDVYGTYLNDELYFLAFERKLQKLFSEITSKTKGRAEVSFDISEDGKFKIDEMVVTEGGKLFEKEVRDSISRCKQFRPMPDGAPSENRREIVFKRGVNDTIDRQDWSDFSNILNILDVQIQAVKDGGAGVSNYIATRNDLKNKYEMGKKITDLKPTVAKLTQGLKEQRLKLRLLKLGCSPDSIYQGPGSDETVLFMTELQFKIKKAWQPLKSSIRQTVILQFKVFRDGTIRDTKVISSARDPALLASCLNALKRVPKLTYPKDETREFLDVRFSFGF